MRRLVLLLAFVALSLAACGAGMLTRASQPAGPATAVRERAEGVRFEARPGDPRAYYHFTLSTIAERRGDLEAALGEIQAALRYDPTSPYLRLSLAGLLIRRGAFPEALREAEEVLRTDPENLRAHLLLASAYLSLRNVKQAEHHFMEILRLEPGRAEIKTSMPNPLAISATLRPMLP